MTQITFFTPSYRGDAQRFALLRESINHFYNGQAKHIVAVPSPDKRLFTKLFQDDKNVEILVQNDFVDPIFYPKQLYKYIERIFPNQTWRFQKYAGRPGWITQQIVKLNIPAIVNNGAVVVLDSDIFFIRPFSDIDFRLNKSLYTLYKAIPESETAKHRGHMKWARDFLGLESGSTEHHYITCPAILYPEIIKELHKFIEKNTINRGNYLSLINQAFLSISFMVFLPKKYTIQKALIL